MKRLFVAVIGVLALVALAGPMPAPTPVELDGAIVAMKGKPGEKRPLSAARFYAEVLGGKTVDVYWSKAPSDAGPASVSAVEREMATRGCKALTGTELAAASKLLVEFGTDLPPTLRAWTLGSEGKGDDAAELFAQRVSDFAVTTLTCPSEHPSGSHQRVRDMSLGLECIKVFAPKRGTLKLELLLKRAEYCARTNTAVG